jgi:hypothetical protein
MVLVGARTTALLLTLLASRPFLVAGGRGAEGTGEDQARHDTQDN